MLVKDITDYLAAENVGTVGVDLFYNDMPPEPDTGVMIEDLTGGVPDYVHDDNAPLVHHLRFQAFSRGPSYDAAEAKAQAVYTALQKLRAGGSINGSSYEAVIPTSDPAKFSTDMQRRVVFHQEFEVIKT